MATVRDSARFVHWYKKRYGTDLSRRHNKFLEQIGYLKPEGVDLMFEVAASHFNVSKDEIQSKSRDPETMDIKRIISFALRYKTSRSAIAKIMCLNDRSSINHHWTSYENLYACDPSFKQKADKFFTILNQL